MSEKSSTRSYRVTTPRAELAKQRALDFNDRIVLAIVMIVACVVRLYGLAWPTSVVFDEVHFGGFARKYIIGRFFFDVHPPLAKMLFAVVGYVAGFRGDFEFKNISDDYIKDNVPYVAMRLFPSVLGLLTIALCYSTLRASGVRTSIAAFGTLLLTFENTHATESRYILLDSPLLFFVAISAYGFKKFQLEVPFTRNWYRFLALTGLGLGATLSSKWVGLFTIAWIGVETLYQLWWIFGDLQVSLPKFTNHFLARAVLLIVLPLSFYIGMFYIHFLCVDNMGDGADFMPRAFAAGLKHNNLPTNVPADVGFGSHISLRHLGTQGGYLHSHEALYETGSKQQQITLYPHMDENNFFIVENGTDTWNPDNQTGPVWLKDGDIIRLNHRESKKRLHSHDHRPPVTTHDYLYEVSGYGFEDFEGDANDNWRVIINKPKSTGVGKEHVQAMRTQFQLQHTLLGCLLYSKKVKLPEWGFEQQEVSCIRNGALPNTLWYIEDNWNPDDLNPERIGYEVPSFWQNFIDIHVSMWVVNKGLTDPHAWESRPLSWLTLQRGINMWGSHNRQVYLIGNLPVYLTITASIALYVLWKFFQILIWQRFSSSTSGLPLPSKIVSASSEVAGLTAWALFDQQFGSFALAWFFHYFPSFLMVRQLFLHHYLSSVYFGILAITQIFELLAAVLPWKRVAQAVTLVYLGAAIWWYVAYSPLIYGTQWTKELCEKRTFNDMDFDCNIFLSSYDDYKSVDESVSASISSARLGLPLETASATISEDQVIPVSEEHVEHVPEPVQEQVEDIVAHQPEVEFIEEPEAVVQPDEPTTEDAEPVEAAPAEETPDVLTYEDAEPEEEL